MRATTVLSVTAGRERTEQVLITLGKDELAKLAEVEPVTEVCCHFCDNKYRFTRKN